MLLLLLLLWWRDWRSAQPLIVVTVTVLVAIVLILKIHLHECIAISRATEYIDNGQQDTKSNTKGHAFLHQGIVVRRNGVLLRVLGRRIRRVSTPTATAFVLFINSMCVELVDSLDR